MNSPQQTCDPEQIKLFLSGELTLAQEQTLQTHLDDCDTCRENMHSQAAEDSYWDEATQLFSDGGYQSCRLLGETRHDELGSGPRSIQTKSVLDMLAPTDDPNMLGRLGPYEVSGVIGAGGMGIVLKAFDCSLDRTVAIKVMAPHLASSGSARRRFAREAKAAAAVLHPNVIAIHGVAADHALPYLVMPYNRGMSLQKRIDQDGPLPLQETLRIAEQIAAGLAAAHAQGLVHRDIKPANILLEDGVERLAITDFGLARAVDDATMTRSGVIAGTPQYMSPEQARGDSIDHRSDLFSLGSVVYSMCTGHPPFRAETTFGILRRITDATPRPIREINSETPTWLCRLVEKLHAKSPTDRIQSASEVANLLQRCLAHVQTSDAPLPPELYLPRKRTRVKWGVAGLTGVAVLAIVLTVWPSTPSANPSESTVASETGESPPQVITELDADTKWDDPFDPSPVEVQALANQLEQETRDEIQDQK